MDSTCATVFRRLSCSLQLILEDCLSICRLSAEMSASAQGRKKRMQCYELWSTSSHQHYFWVQTKQNLTNTVHQCILSVCQNRLLKLLVTDFQFVWVDHINLAIMPWPLVPWTVNVTHASDPESKLEAGSKAAIMIKCTFYQVLSLVCWGIVYFALQFHCCPCCPQVSSESCLHHCFHASLQNMNAIKF